MSVNVYPNPNSGHFSLEIVGVNQEVNVAIMDFAGRLVLEQKLQDVQSDKLIQEFDLSSYERGIYFLRITQGEKVSYQRVVIQ